MTEQELKKEQFITKAMANKANFELHKNLIEKHLCIGGEMYIKDLKALYERQVVDNQLLLNLMEYAEEYSKLTKIKYCINCNQEQATRGIGEAKTVCSKCWNEATASES